jgi:hypothetical protein
MSETGRPTALGVARARFVESLPRKAAELRASTALIVASPSEERPREELRRRLHALWASAQVFQIEALCDALKDAIGRLDRARDPKSPLRQEDLDALAALAATLPLLTNKTPPGAPAVPSLRPPADDVREASPMRLRPPRASAQATESIPSVPAESEPACIVALFAPSALVEAVRDVLAGDPGIEIHTPDPDEAPHALLARCGPDAILCADATDAAALRESAVRIGATLRVLGGELLGASPSAAHRERLGRALKVALRDLPSLVPAQIAARLEDLEGALASDRPRVSNRFDGLSIGALLDRVKTGRPNSTIHLRDTHDAIDAEMRDGMLCDVIRTARDGWFSRGAPALIALLGMRRGLVSVERATGPVRSTLPGPDTALTAGRERLSALELATRPPRIDGIASIEIDADAAPSARKERAVDPRVLDALVRIGALAPLLEGGTSREGLSAALLALARAGALRAIRGPEGEDRIEEALVTVRERPLESEPEIRTPTQAPPALQEVRRFDEGEDDESALDERDESASGERAAPERATQEAAEPPRAESARVNGASMIGADASDLDDDGDLVAPRPHSEDDAAQVPYTGNGLLYAAAIAALFLVGFVVWGAIRDGDGGHDSTPTEPPVANSPATTEARSTPEPSMDEPPAPSEPIASAEPLAPAPPAVPDAFGSVRANHSAPPQGQGWLVSEAASGWSVEGRELAPGVPMPLALGVHAVTLGAGETARVRFVRVSSDRTRVLPAL